MDDKGMTGDTMGAGTPPTDPAASDQGADGKKQVLITDNGDGSFTVQPMAEGQPAGDAVPAKSLDEAMQSATDTLGGGTNPDQAGDAGAAPNPDAGADLGGEVSPTDPAAADAIAEYKNRQGTRPKAPPSWKDYSTGSNPLAK